MILAAGSALPTAQGAGLATRPFSMPSQDPAQWFEDPNVYIDDETLIAEAKTLEAAVLHGGSRGAAAVWIIFVSIMAGAFGGFTFSDDVRSSWLSFVLYLGAGALVLVGLLPVSTKLLNSAVAWQAAFAFFWAFLLAMVAVLGAGIETNWISHTVTIGGGLFIGLMYGSLASPFAQSADAWLMTAIPLGALSTWSASAVQRGFNASTNPAWSEAYVGTMAAAVFMVPMAVLVAMISSRANGLAKMATLYLHNDNFVAKAIEYLDEAIALKPRSADLYNLRGVAYSKVGDRERADADFTRVSELSPRAAEAHMNRGVDLMRQGDYDRSIEALKLAIRVNPKLATAFSNLGTTYQKKGDLDAAIESYTRAIALRSKYPIAYSNRSYSYYLKGEYDRAIADAVRAIDLDAGLAMAHANLGHAYAGKGETGKAIRSYRQALDLTPDHEVEAETLAALEKLGAARDDGEDDDL
jgi:tetratricopeptide (TPR) repeat protein